MTIAPSIPARPPELPPEPPAEPLYPALLEAARLMRERGIVAGTYGREHEQRCTIGYIFEATGGKGNRPGDLHFEEQADLYQALSDALPPIGQNDPRMLNVGDWSDDFCSRAHPRHAARQIADLLERVAYGL